MSKHPIKASGRSITAVRQTSPVTVHDAGETVKTEGARRFLSFEYSYTEMSSRDGRTHVRANKTRFADGKLTREAFEGQTRRRRLSAHRGRGEPTDDAHLVVVCAVDTWPALRPRVTR